MRSRCQDECEADVKATAKPMSRMHSQMETSSQICFTCVCIDYSVWPSRPATQYILQKPNRITVQFPDNAKPMSRRTRSRCQYYSAKPISKRMRSRCQDECKADVIIMRSRCQGECEADVNTNAKPMSRRPRSRCREGSHTRTRRMEVHTHTNKLTPNGNTQSDMFYLCLH